MNEQLFKDTMIAGAEAIMDEAETMEYYKIPQKLAAIDQLSELLKNMDKSNEEYRKYIINEINKII